MILPCVRAKRIKFRVPLMAVVIRLRREGTKNTPFYRIVVTDSRLRRDGRFLEQIGTYDPRQAGENYKIDLGKASAWMGQGAKPSETVASIIKKASRKAS
jgi:small subunit ribosomal protein S16